MKKIYTMILTTVVLLCAGSGNVSAQTVTVGELTYIISGTNAYVRSVVDATQTDITIPASITYDKNGTETTFQSEVFIPVLLKIMQYWKISMF